MVNTVAYRDTVIITAVKSFILQVRELSLSGVYTGDKTLHVVAIASSGDLKRWENFH
jgi:hypothetical protein